MVIRIYTDGSYCDEDGMAHGGIVMMGNGDEILGRLHIISTIPSLSSMRNVGGEIIAAWAAIKSIDISAQNGKYRNEPVDVIIYHDYEGVSKWVEGYWRAKKTATAWYAQSVKRILQSGRIHSLKFSWVRGHGDNFGNKEADAVANYEMRNFGVLGVQVLNLDKLIMEDGLR